MWRDIPFVSLVVTGLAGSNAVALLHAGYPVLAILFAVLTVCCAGISVFLFLVAQHNRTTGDR